MHLFKNESLRLLEIAVTLEVDNPITWGSFPGSVLHGALGFTVKKRSCIREDEQCETCRLLYECMYPRLFESMPPKGTERMRKYPRIPPGLRLKVEPWKQPVLKPGDGFTLGFTLLGKSIDDANQLLLALEDVIQRGLGRKSDKGGRGTAAVGAILQPGADPIQWEALDFTEKLPFTTRRWSEMVPAVLPDFRIVFNTPTRIVSRGSVTSNPSFRDIFSTVLRRLSNLAYFYCETEIDTDYRKLVNMADKVEYRSSFRRSEQTRYSARQKKRMAMDGLLGSMEVFNCPEELFPWLAIGSKVGIGKNTSMGMGDYNLNY